MKLLAVVGMPGSGKGEFSSVAKTLGVPVVVMGDVIREEVTKQGLSPTDESMGVVARKLREQYGMAAIAHVCIPVINRQKGKIILVDGVRGDAEVREFTQAFPGFSLVAIDAPLEIRFSRLSLRGRSDDLAHIDELKARDERECSFGLDKAMKLATVRLSNTGSREEFEEKVKEFLYRLEKTS